MISNKPEWAKFKKHNTDRMGAECVRVAERIMKMLDEMEKTKEELVAPERLIVLASDALRINLNFYTAGAVAMMVARCHSRGEEFRIKWNSAFGIDEATAKGKTVQPTLETVAKMFASQNGKETTTRRKS